MIEGTLPLLVVVVGFAAGVIRGFAGFGGPAFIIAVLTWFMSPVDVIDKVLVIEIFVGAYLVWEVRKRIDWRTTATLTIPVFIGMPFGHWLLLITNADLMGRVIAGLILLASIIMLCDIRLKARYSTPVLMAIGLVGGVIFGASYIALVLVAMVLMAPYDRSEVRTLFFVSGFLMACWFLILSVHHGQASFQKVVAAIPLMLGYLAGCRLGSRLFQGSTETNYRRYALYLLGALAVVGLIR